MAAGNKQCNSLLTVHRSLMLNCGDNLLDAISVLLVKGDSISRIHGFDGSKLCSCMHWGWNFHIPELASLI